MVNTSDKKRNEFELIELLTKDFKIQNSETITAIGDDAAVLDLHGKSTVITTDLLLEAIHFDLSFVPMKHLGYKAISTNISDICAMNATPKQVLVSIGVPERITENMLVELYSGIKAACDLYHVDLVGGDTSASASGLTISVTATGTAKIKNLAYRKSAKESDVICVTGDLGAAYAGLMVLQNAKKTFIETNKQPDINKYKYIVERQLKPEARVDVVNLLSEKDIIPSSMIDISDGLAADLFHICKDSNLGCIIYEDKLPIAKETSVIAKENDDTALNYALNGGEDYELLFTVTAKDFDKIKEIDGISPIGYTTSKESGCVIYTREDKQEDIKPKTFSY